MLTKRLSLLLPVAIAATLVGGAAQAATHKNASVLIRHQVQGCHSWSVDGGATFKPTQSLTLQRGALVTFTNTDVMPHTLVLTSGPALRIPHPTLNQSRQSLKLTFTRPGVYHFTTKAGEDYVAGVKTTGPDNVLKLTVVVT